MGFVLAGPIEQIETIATGGGIRELPRLRKLYGKARWRKMKGVATIELQSGALRRAELHWYELMASGARSSRSRGSCDARRYYG